MIECKSVNHPDEHRDFPHGHLDVLEMQGMTFGKALFEPGWRWSQDVKPLAGTDSCMAEHKGYVESGHLHVRMDDGQEVDFGPGDAMVVTPGHDAWVTGSEACVVYDFAGAANYAKGG
ncbi:cupin domain-containing protein [Streptomyces sp. NA04227]|uniref:cupin domain-containing protein n=1 Tax=Streptomyces sp. NA04227 TaxID=2742136 RepID=UPI0015906E73|nr:cupin domain-containing protein [Streptomyces sp. NA04227]QKW10713.1 cupin domain-containing protein [Streptomyces sp. NA04227]